MRDGIVAASRFAELDPYRAATHNKGIMNGVDAVVIATGNDWRAVEAGAHAFAARERAATARSRSGAPTASDLVGELEMPMARRHRRRHAARAPRRAARARACSASARRPSSACVVGAAGLASNLAALRALATEGIQRGHMALHARALGPTAGTSRDTLREVVK